MRTKPAILFTVISTVLALSAFSVYGQHRREISEQYGKLAEFYRVVASHYLDSIDYGAVVEKGITSMLAELDPHSAYLTAKELKASNEELGGGFSGIGIEFNTLNDTIVVAGVVAGAPAERVGVLPNDRIVAIDGKNVVGIDRLDVPRYLRGPKGTKVSVEIFRRGESDLLDFTIVRDDIPINTVDAAYKPDPHTGYIKVNRFGATTGREFAEAFSDLADIDALILDLRGNGGGFLPEAIRMSEFFLDRGQRVVSTEGRSYPIQSHDNQHDGRFNHGRLIVLVDETSASASEIVAGAVQDWDRGIVMGNTTFGKGLVQREFSLPDGSALRLTIARYLTPAGRAIQRPYTMGQSEAYYRDAMDRRNRRGREDTLALRGEAGEEFRTLRSGRVVRGMGGIEPDLKVPADTVGYSSYWAAIVRSGRLREFVQSHLDTNRVAITEKYPEIESYIADFDATALLPDLVEYAARHGIERDPEGLEVSRGWLAGQIKALIAGQLWDTTGYYRVGHATFDVTFRRAMDAMRRWREIPCEPGAPVTDEIVRVLSRAT